MADNEEYKIYMKKLIRNGADISRHSKDCCCNNPFYKSYKRYVGTNEYNIEA